MGNTSKPSQNRFSDLNIEVLGEFSPPRLQRPRNVMKAIDGSYNSNHSTVNSHSPFQKASKGLICSITPFLKSEELATTSESADPNTVNAALTFCQRSLKHLLPNADCLDEMIDHYTMNACVIQNVGRVVYGEEEDNQGEESVGEEMGRSDEEDEEVLNHLKVRDSWRNGQPEQDGLEFSRVVEGFYDVERKMKRSNQGSDNLERAAGIGEEGFSGNELVGGLVVDEPISPIKLKTENRVHYEGLGLRGEQDNNHWENCNSDPVDNPYRSSLAVQTKAQKRKYFNYNPFDKLYEGVTSRGGPSKNEPKQFVEKKQPNNHFLEDNIEQLPDTRLISDQPKSKNSNMKQLNCKVFNSQLESKDRKIRYDENKTPVITLDVGDLSTPIDKKKIGQTRGPSQIKQEEKKSPILAQNRPKEHEVNRESKGYSHIHRKPAPQTQNIIPIQKQVSSKQKTTKPVNQLLKTPPPHQRTELEERKRSKKNYNKYISTQEDDEEVEEERESPLTTYHLTGPHHQNIKRKGEMQGDFKKQISQVKVIESDMKYEVARQMASKDHEELMRDNYFSGRPNNHAKRAMDSRQDLVRLMGTRQENSPLASGNKLKGISNNGESVARLVDIHKLSEQAMIEIDEM